VRQAFFQQGSVERLQLLAGDLVQALAAEDFLDAQSIEFIIPQPAAFPRLDVRQVMPLEELGEGQDFLLRLCLPARIGTESDFGPERLCLLACIGQREVDRAANFLMAGLAATRLCW